MKKLLAILLRPPVPQLAGLLLLSAVIWFGGRALRSWHGLADGTLLLIVAGVWLLAALLFVWRRLQARKRARMIEDRLRGQAREHKQSVRPDKRNQVEELERQLGEALNALKTSKLGNSALYSLPWYIIIGPPGSGKTTLLRESGLSFPQQTHGRGVRGVGGTRNCDWWFTDQGILLDTAGRYTTQDEDRSEWLSFLDMLKKSRSKKPINGAIIAISIADIVTATDDQLAEHARKVRERLAELTDRLEVLFPVYVMFSKCDLLDGFVDLFGGYGKQERGQMWGFTLPYQEKNAMSLAERFDREFDHLHQRLCAERLQVLGTTRSQAKKARIFSFPMQFAMARERLRSFLLQIDQPNPYSESSEIRGFYFTSGTQEGQPLDHVLAQMRKATGLAEEADDAEREPVDKKAYFIDELFTEVVFPDKDLAQSSAKAERRRWLLHRVGMIGAGVAALIGLVVLVTQYVHHADVIRRAKTAYADAVGFDPSVKEAIDQEEALYRDAGGPFERLRRMFVELDDDYGSVGSYLMGETNALYQQRIRRLYVQKLASTFVAPLQQRLAARLQQVVDDDRPITGDELRLGLLDTVTCYRMLGGKVMLDEPFLQQQLIGTAWTWTPGAERPACLPHRDTFLERVVGTAGDWQVEALEGLIEGARKRIETKTVLETELESVIVAQGQDDTVSWSKILDTYNEAKLLDPAIGITAAFTQRSLLERALEEKGKVRGSGEAEDLVATGQSAARKAWRSLLANIRPLPRENVADAMNDIAALTAGELYVSVYRMVCANLTELGAETVAGDTGWLSQLLQEINGLEQQVLPLTASNGLYARVLPIAKGADHSRLDNLRDALAKARRSIETKVPTAASLRGEITEALINLVKSLEYALCAEIVAEANTAWAKGLGQQLAEFGKQFPFATNAEQGLDTGVFKRTFGKGEDFDDERQWIEYLEGLLSDLYLSGPTAAFEADRRLVRRMQEALFRGDDPQCEIEIVLEKRGSSTDVMFRLGQQSVSAPVPTIKPLTWRPSDGASIKVIGFRALNGTVDATIDVTGSWGLVRLLAMGTPGEWQRNGVPYEVCTWSDFRKDGAKVVYNDEVAEARLRFRTLAEPNPLKPGFFTHAFAEEVFKKPLPPGGPR